MANELDYTTGTFLGRKFRTKGTSKVGEWKLFKAKFQINSVDNKFTVFGNPRKGLSIEDLKEGEDYTIGYKSEERTFTGNEGNEVTYTQKTIVFIDVPKDAGQKELSENVVILDETKKKLVDQIRGLPETVKRQDFDNKIKIFFKETSEVELEELWHYFLQQPPKLE